MISGKGNAVTGYVIMPNHLHLLLHYIGGSQSLNTIVGNGKRFMAYDIIERLECQGEDRLLSKLKSGVQPHERKRGKKHKVWESALMQKNAGLKNFFYRS